MKYRPQKQVVISDRRSFLKKLGMVALVGGLSPWTRLFDTAFRTNALAASTSESPEPEEAQMPEKIIKTEEEWRQLLTPEQFKIMRKKGTERAFTGEYHNFKGEGTYVCAACDLPLFSSEAKYDSGTGWPSFWAPIAETHIRTEPDHSLLMRRTEVLCARCDGHLGHVFKDGPPPTGLRYCLNSVALRFVPKEDGEDTESES